MSYSNGDLIFISKNPIDNVTQKEHTLGIVEKFINSELLIVKVVLIQKDPRSLALGSFLTKNSEWLVTRICNLATINREYQALLSIDSLKLSDLLMHPGNINLLDSNSNNNNNNKESIVNINSSIGSSNDYFFIPRNLESKLKFFFNNSQLEALRSSIKKKGLTLIQGPPGTGKSTTILGILSVILNSLAKKEGSNRKDSVLTSINQEFLGLKYNNLNPNSHPNELVDEIETRRNYGKNLYNPKQQPWLWEDCYATWMDEAISHDQHFIEFPQSKNSDCFKILQKPEEDEVSPPEKILVCAPSNVAIDEIVRKIISVGLIDSNGNKFMPKFVRIGPNYHPSLREFALDYQMTERINLNPNASSNTGGSGSEAKETDKIKNEILLTVKIVCSTLSMAGSNILTMLNQKFDTVVIDEAAQAVELSTLIPLKYGCERLILVGDPKQLAATVFSETSIKFNYDQSLFKRFQEAGHEVVILKTQYRMHRVISKFISDTFYDGLLEDDKNIDKSTESEPCLKSPAFQPLTFYDIESEEGFDNNSYFNEDQINIILMLVEKLKNYYTPKEIVEKVSVISPYSNQVFKIKENLKHLSGFNAENTGFIDVNTVDGFQGKEKQIIIFSTVRSQGSKTIGFLADERRMNVGLSRAKSCLIVIGDSKKLMSDKNWDKLVKYSFRHAAFYKVKGDIENYFNNFENNYARYKVSNEEQFVKMIFNPTTIKSSHSTATTHTEVS